MDTKRVSVTCCMLLAFFFMAGVICADTDPNDPIGACYMTSGALNADGECPSWQTVIDRPSSDGYTYLYLKVEVDSCYYTHYDLYTVEQDSTPEPIYLEPNDVFIVWDEDQSHGSTVDFTFTGGQYIEVTNPATQCPYVYISSHPVNNHINWKLYKVEESGTLTINDTDLNEHEAIHFHHMRVEKYDDVDTGDCRSPGQSIEYTICFENLDADVIYEDAYVIDWLPDGVDYANAGYSAVYDGNSIQIVPPDPGYNDDDHSYVWLLGDILGNDANCLTLDVEVNYKAEPNSILHNVAELWAFIDDPNGNPVETLVATVTEDTVVCCWGDEPNIIYVDKAATGTDVGSSWQNAYTDLADALRRATNSDCSSAYTIYVAQGTYNPENTPDKTFQLPDYCSVYGGFPSGGCPFENRNPMQYETILTGLIDEDTIPDADTVVTMGDECLINGLTVTNSFENAVYGSGVDFEVAESVITENYDYGIFAESGNVTVQRCTISLNDADGIYHEGEGFTLTVENSWILRNGEYGLHSRNSTPTVKNSIISECDLIEAGRAGIRLYRPADSPKLYNCTISNNKAEGIYFSDTGTPDWPELKNCIVYYNNIQNDSNQLAGLIADNVAYNCCIQDCNEVNSNHNDVPGFAYTIDPNGTPNPANYHLAGNSFCIDKGAMIAGLGDDDYDGEDRVMGTTVDIGADEVNPNCGDVANPLDADADGIVNFYEFAPIAQVWLAHDPNDPVCDPNHPQYIADPNAPGYISELQKLTWNVAYNYDTTGNSEYAIDLADLMYIVDDWLWIACWKQEQMETAAAQSQNQSQIMVAQPLSMSVAMTPMSLSSYSTVETTTNTVEPIPEVSADTLVQMLGFLDEVIADGGDNIDNIEDMRAILMDDLKAILDKEGQ